jgi:uncharacterized membrane protein
LISITASLAGCSGPSPLASDFNLVGADPFWAIQISTEGKTAKFSRPGESDLDIGFPGESKGQAGAVVLTSTSPEGDVVMTLTKKDCLDGMSDRKYPYEVSVVYKGRTLKGCGASKQFISEHPGG